MTQPAFPVSHPTVHRLRQALAVTALGGALLIPASPLEAQTRRATPSTSLDFSEEDFGSSKKDAPSPGSTPSGSAPPTTNRSMTQIPQAIACSKDYPHLVGGIRGGDHLVLSDGTEIKLLGVSCPPPAGPQNQPICHGVPAAEFTRDSVAGKCVRVEIPRGPAGKDASGNAMGYVYYLSPTGQQVTLNEEVVRAGHGIAPPDLPHPRRMEYLQLQASARAARKGLWGSCYEWKSERELGSFGTDGAGNKLWKQQGGPSILVRTKPLASGSFNDQENNIRIYDDATMTNGELIGTVAEGIVAPGFSLSEIQRAVQGNPDLHIWDFIQTGGHSRELLRAYKHGSSIAIPAGSLQSR